MSPLYAELFGDAEAAALFTDAAEIAAMLRVEAALARVQGQLGLIPPDAAAAIAAIAPTLRPDPAALAAGTASAGVPVPALVAALRAALPDAHAPWVHFGPTSQDIADTALVLRLRDWLDLIDARLGALIRALGAQAARHRDTVMAARTRGQLALPTSFGARIAVWCAPFLDHRRRLAQLRPRLLRVSLAGAAGTNAAMAPRGAEVAAALAAALDLAPAPVPWHAARDAIAELAGLMALLTGSLGKIGTDLLAMAQSELGEARAGAGGGSSTMPHKQNPVGAEALVSLARHNAGRAGAMLQAMLHGAERDGAAWGLEWLTLPDMAVTTAAALRHGLAAAEALTADPAAMTRSIARMQGLIMAEAASFHLAATMPRPEADAAVKAACARTLAEGRSLAAILAEDLPGHDWESVLAPAAYLGEAGAIVDGLVARIGRELAEPA